MTPPLVESLKLEDRVDSEPRIEIIRDPVETPEFAYLMGAAFGYRSSDRAGFSIPKHLKKARFRKHTQKITDPSQGVALDLLEARVLHVLAEGFHDVMKTPEQFEASLHGFLDVKDPKVTLKGATPMYGFNFRVDTEQRRLLTILLENDIPAYFEGAVTSIVGNNELEIMLKHDQNPENRKVIRAHLKKLKRSYLTFQEYHDIRDEAMAIVERGEHLNPSQIARKFGKDRVQVRKTIHDIAAQAGQTFAGTHVVPWSVQRYEKVIAHLQLPNIYIFEEPVERNGTIYLRNNGKLVQLRRDLAKKANGSIDWDDLRSITTKNAVISRYGQVTELRPLYSPSTPEEKSDWLFTMGVMAQKSLNPPDPNQYELSRKIRNSLARERVVKTIARATGREPSTKGDKIRILGPVFARSYAQWFENFPSFETDKDRATFMEGYHADAKVGVSKRKGKKAIGVRIPKTEWASRGLQKIYFELGISSTDQDHRFVVTEEESQRALITKGFITNEEVRKTVQKGLEERVHTSYSVSDYFFAMSIYEQAQEIGQSRRSAAREAGINYQTFSEWVGKEGAPGRTPPNVKSYLNQLNRLNLPDIYASDQPTKRNEKWFVPADHCRFEFTKQAQLAYLDLIEAPDRELNDADMREIQYELQAHFAGDTGREFQFSVFDDKVTAVHPFIDYTAVTSYTPPPPEPEYELSAEVEGQRARNLFSSVMALAVEDIITGRLAKEPEVKSKNQLELYRTKKRNQADAEAWLEGNDRSYVFSFNSICENLDTDADRMRSIINDRIYEATHT